MPAGTWWVVRVDDGPVRCEAWTAGSASLAIGDHAIDFTTEGARVYLACGDAWSVHEVDGELDVDGATWFHARATCEAAIRKHARVAMDAPACTMPAPVVGKTARAAFERVMAHGGALYGDDCSATAVRVDERTAQSARGHLISVSEDADWRTTTSQPYDLTFGSDKLITTNPETTSVAKHAGLTPSGSYGCICADDNPLTFGEDWVELFAQHYYFSAAACRRARATTRRLASWHAAP